MRGLHFHREAEMSNAGNRRPVVNLTKVAEELDFRLGQGSGQGPRYDLLPNTNTASTLSAATLFSIPSWIFHMPSLVASPRPKTRPPRI
jgi:hypothetical protein